MSALRVPVRVTPGARRAHVGGAWVVGDGPAWLRVTVTARAVDGAANDAARDAVAHAFGVRSSDVRLVSGASSRSKLFHIDPAPLGADARLTELLTAGG